MTFRHRASTARALVLWSMLFAGLGPAALGQPVPRPSDEAPKRPLGEVLLAFANELHIDLIYDPALVADKRTAYAIGEGSAEWQLRQLLRGTDLAFKRLTSGTYVLIPARDPPRAPARSLPASGRLTGFVMDQTTGAPLEGAHVLLADLLAGSATNASGLFSVDGLRPGLYRVMTRHLGYGTRIDTVRIDPGASRELFLTLEPRTVHFQPIIIEDLKGQLAFRASTVLSAPDDLTRSYSMGTADVVRSLNHLMGVRVGDVLAEVHVQGGESGEHQFRLDGVPVFEPVHLRGLLGAFNPFAIERITVHKAGFRAAHGSYLAGVIEADHSLGAPGRTVFDAQVDPLSLNALFQTGTSRERPVQGQLMLAGRASLWSLYPANLYPPLRNLLREWNTPDAFLPNASVLALKEEDPLLAEILASQFDTLQLSSVSDPALGFNDLHAAGRLRFGPRHNVYGSVYLGHNRLNGNRLSVHYDPEATQRAAAAFSDPEPQTMPANRDDYRWINANGQVRYTAILGSNAFASARLRGSRYSLSHAYNTLDQRTLPLIQTPGGFFVVRPTENVKPTDDGNRISEVAAEGTLDYALSARHTIHLGTEAARMASRFSIEDVNFQSIANAASGWRLAGFAEDRVTLGDAWTLTLGSRLTYLPQHARFYGEPRAEIRFDRPASRLGAWSFRLATGLYRQFVNQFNVSSVSPSALLPAIRFWLPVDSTVAPPKAAHLAGGLLFMPNPIWSLRAEAYLKRQYHLLAIDYPSLWTNLREDSLATVQSDFLRPGRGRAYGGAVAAERATIHTRLRIRYEYSMARRTRTLLPRTALPDLVEDAGDASADSLGRFEPVPWNEPHRLELGFDWMPDEHLTLTARWRGVWGTAWAFRQAYYDYLATDPFTRHVFGPYDLREPHRHRRRPLYQLDLGVAYSLRLGAADLQLRADVLNVLDRLNEADWSLVETSGDDDDTPQYERVPRALLPRMPSVALRMRW